ncbi:hypothetical protein HDU93_002401, partial [Gonapodya sp. JEL0774]
MSRPNTFKYEDVPDLTGQVALITGASAGIGKATVAALAKKGAHVICVGRNPEKSNAAIAEIIRATGNPKIEYIEADFGDLASVDRAATSFLERDLPLNMFIMNAGAMFSNFELSKDGIEKQFATNHLSHFLLTKRLLPSIEKTALSGTPVRIVAVSSMSQSWVPPEGIALDKVNDEKSYKALARYSETKLANILFVNTLQRILDAKHGQSFPVFCNSLHPGAVTTEFFRYSTTGILGVLMKYLGKILFLSPEQGAMSSVFLATSPEVMSKSIRAQYYLEQARPALPKDLHPKANDIASQDELWAWSERILTEK